MKKEKYLQNGKKSKSSDLWCLPGHISKYGIMDAVKIYNYNNNIEIHILYTAVGYQIQNNRGYYLEFNYVTAYMTISMIYTYI